ncbi:hypothetical protein HPB47_009268 [Ixodes persulcatus]|uniref:Uncharacterized protein n=1 Tax=Ixodes persulcatus TaxID=34615 RepID=A0AC60P2C7_IXOPE|nr:hypothetical protein HPB47_009268 [Ixodes persulcatus]
MANAGQFNAPNGDTLQLPFTAVQNFRLQPFWPKNPTAQFRLRHIASQETRYLHTVSSLPADVAEELVDILATPDPVSPFDQLKTTILDRKTEIERSKLQFHVNTEELGDRRPSLLLHRIGQLLGAQHRDPNNHLLRELFLQRLSSIMVPVLAVAEDMSLDKLPEHADRVADYSRPPGISAVANRSPATKSEDSGLSPLEEHIEALSRQIPPSHPCHGVANNGLTSRLLKAYSKPTSSSQRLYHRPFEVSLAPEGLLRMEPSATFSEFQRCGSESRNESRRVRTAGHLSKPAQNESQRVRDVIGTALCCPDDIDRARTGGPQVPPPVTLLALRYSVTVDVFGPSDREHVSRIGRPSPSHRTGRRLIGLRGVLEPGMGCGGSTQAPLPLDVVVTYPQKDTAAAVVKPQQNSCKPAKDENDSQQISQESLHLYLKHEKRIQLLERRRTLQSYQVKVDLLQQLEVAATNLENDRQRLSQMLKAVTDLFGEDELMTIKDELLKQRELEGLLPEQEEYLDNMNRLEVCQNELKATQAQIEVIQKEIKVLSKECEELAQLYQDRDNLLDTIFGGSSGSELEGQLALDLEKLQICKQQVDHTHFKWSQALLMVRQACAQLSRALKKWRDLASIPERQVPHAEPQHAEPFVRFHPCQKENLCDNEKRYYCVKETRNNLSAALQNLQGSQRYLHNIDFPYCTPSEIETVYKAVTYIFTDMKTPDRYEHALNCYHTTYRRAGALKQWIELVINNVINHDLDILEERCHEKFAQLRKERVRLIQQRMKNNTGKDITLINGDSGMENDADDTFKDGQPVQLFRPERSLSRESSMTPDTSSTAGPTPVPTSDLAPMPPTEKIFGKVVELRHQHHEQMKALKKVQALRQARLSKALQRKIEARRHRKSVTPQVREA